MITKNKQTIEKLEQEKKHWDNLIKVWNNKKLDEDVRRKAEMEIDKLTDEGKGEIEIEEKLQATLKTSIDWCEDEIKFLKKWDRFYGSNDDLIKLHLEMEKRRKQLTTHLKWLKEKQEKFLTLTTQ